MPDSELKLRNILEAALLAAAKPLQLKELQALFLPNEQPELKQIETTLMTLAQSYQDRGIELVEVAGAWRLQVKAQMAPWIARLWEEKPAKYSRALLETLALIAYRQPITRGEIEAVRGVAVSSHIIKTLLERDWIKLLGHRDLPGKPALYGTTNDFLAYFGLNSLQDLPELSELRDFDPEPELALDNPNQAPPNNE